MHIQKITTAFDRNNLDKNSFNKKRVLNSLAITSAILLGSVVLTACFKTETEKTEIKCQSGDAVSCVNAAKAYASGKDSKATVLKKALISQNSYS